MAAATLVLAATVPTALAATGASSWNYSVGHRLPIVVNGSVQSNPYELTARDSGNVTGYFPVFYFDQALKGIGYQAQWDGQTRTWAIDAPGLSASSISIPGGVGSGNTTITVNGQVVKKINTYAAKDPAGGPVTTYFPAFYINEIFNSMGAQVSFSGQTGLTINKQSPSTGTGAISTATLTGQVLGTGAQDSPATSFGKPVTISAKLTDPNGNPLVGVNALLDIISYGGGAPTVKGANGNSLPAQTVTTSDGTALQYKVPTDGQGIASAQISVGPNIEVGYVARFEAPYNVAGSTATLKSPKAYIGFVPPNKLGISPFAAPGNPFEVNAASGSNSASGLVPVVVVIPPGSQTSQSGIPVTFQFVNPGSAFFSSQNGSSLGTNAQTVYTNKDGVALVFVNAASDTSAVIGASVTGYNDAYTMIQWSQSGIVNKLSNKTASGYQTQTSSDSMSPSYSANLGDNVTFQATAEDANGNPVANAQLLIASSELNNGQPTNSAHGGYVGSDGNTTNFPNVSVMNLNGSTNAATLGDVVTTDSAGNFSFTVNDNKIKDDGYYVYTIQGGVVQDLLWNPSVQWQTGTSLNYIGIAGAGGKIGYSDNSVTGLVGQAQLPPYSPANLTQVRFDGFVGNDAPISTNLNQTYTLSTSGEKDAAIWGIHVDQPNTSAGTFDNGWYELNPGNRGVGSITLRVAQNASNANQYDVYVNGTLIGSNIQTGWTDTSNGADGQYPGTIQLAMADDDSGNATLTVSSAGKTATAAITFNGGSPVEAEGVSPAQAILTNGQSQTVSLTLEDSNGNPVANTLGAIKFANAANLWVTKVNGVALQMNESGGANGNGSAPEPTPIPLFDTSSLTNPLGYSDSGVNVSGVATWSPSSSGAQTVYAYSDSNGNISLTLEDGTASYWASSKQAVSAPTNTAATQTYNIYSPRNSGTQTPAFAVYVGPAGTSAAIPNSTATTANWTQEGTITWDGTDSASSTTGSGSGSSTTLPATSSDITAASSTYMSSPLQGATLAGTLASGVTSVQVTDQTTSSASTTVTAAAFTSGSFLVGAQKGDVLVLTPVTSSGADSSQAVQITVQ